MSLLQDIPLLGFVVRPVEGSKPSRSDYSSAPKEDAQFIEVVYTRRDDIKGRGG
jgi:hypothetical protein